MKNIVKVVVSLWISFMLVWTPFGMRVTMPEFWATPWLYGIPLLLLAWPLYFPVFRRIRQGWALPIVGALLALFPHLILVLVDVVSGQSRSISLSKYLPWHSVFGLWYAAFGVVLGAWVGLTRNRMPATVTRATTYLRE